MKRYKINWAGRETEMQGNSAKEVIPAMFSELSKSGINVGDSIPARIYKLNSKGQWDLLFATHQSKWA